MTQLPLNGIAPLSHLGVIRVEGDDAAKFLHGQLTQDYALLGLGEARLSAFLSAKGRMQASMVGLKRSTTEVLLVISQDLLATTLKRLSMFVMRAKAKLTDASADFALYGLVGDTVAAVAGSTAPAWTKADVGSASVIYLYPAAGQPRALWIAPSSEPAPTGPALDPGLWQWSEVQSGVPTLTQPLFEAFVPQMLNYESVGGVNFKKGCYPGQEVVARSQFRGTLKRRAYIAHADNAVTVGAEVFAVGDLEQPCGTVVQVATAPGGGFDLILSMQISAAEGSLQVGAPEGVALTLQPLPYALLDDI
ncbi:folate-binding protein YgfZ [Acidovorax sp. A1169]|uniref:CAF17-like 4Fe-4S cluster assembly/insertion protein YgfZ n=1 Tax=Acidovorax sp. A1169 TaxID=3059524 RepID=UPI002737F741|nr:folate-binding protein [Acidovorax sp. A1169]MDP4075299.1 folate-binding protein [Acidovorax sp. A1169]